MRRSKGSYRLLRSRDRRTRAGSTPARNRLPRLVTCRMRVELPPSTWLHFLTFHYPDCRIEVLDRLMLTEARLHGTGLSDMVRALERFRAVKQVEILEGGHRMTL